MHGSRPAGGGVGQKIYDLLAAGYPESEIIQALELLDDVDWSITPAEQGHRHASGIMRAHPGYCQNTMQARSQLGQLNALWPADGSKSQEAMLLRKLHQLQRVRPNSLQCRHEFIGGLLTLAHPKKRLGLLADRPGLDKKVFGGIRWNSRPSEMKRLWEEKAAESRAIKARRLDEEKSEVLHQLVEIRSKTSSEGDDSRPPCRFSMCRFSDVEVQRFDALWEDFRYTRSKLEVRRAFAVQSVGPPPLGIRQRIEAFLPERPAPSAPLPGWMRKVAVSRGEFGKSLLRVRRGDGQPLDHYSFLFARLSPQTVVVFLRVRTAPNDASNGGPRISPVSGQPWKHLFKHDLSDFAFSDEEEWPPSVDEVHVFENTCFFEGCALACDEQPRALAAKLAECPEAELAAPARPGGPRGVAKEDLLRDFPWLQDFLSPPPSHGLASSSSGSGSGSTKASAADTDDSEGKDIDVEGVFDELYRRRLVLAHDIGDDKDANFTWDLGRSMDGRAPRRHRRRFLCSSCNPTGQAFR